jgi:hypothetical protein
MFMQSWSLAASVVPALWPTLISLVFFALSALVTHRFWYRVLVCNLLIGLAFGVLHFNTPDNYTSSLGGKLLTYRGHHTQFGHLVALLGYAVTVAGNLLGFIGYRYWMSWAARAAASKDHAR